MLKSNFLSKKRNSVFNNYSEKLHAQPHLYVFLSLMFLGFILAIIMLFIDLSSIDCIIWSGESKGVFPDFFQSVLYKQDPYALYPPSVYLFLDFILLFIPNKLEKLNCIALSLTGALYIALLFFAVLIAVLLLLLFKYGKNGISQKISLCLVLAASTPFIYMIERGNLVIVSVVCSAAFLFLNKSRKRYLRVISYLCIAIAAAFKIYPAILGLILVYEKRFKAVGVCIIFGLILCVLPFAFRGGFHKFLEMLNNLEFYQSQSEIFGTAFKVDLTNLCNMIGDLTGIERGISEKAGIVICFVFFIAAIVGAAFIKPYWKKAALLVSTLILCMPFSWVYTLCFYIPVVILFFNESKTDNMVEKIGYSILFALLFVLIPFGKPGFIDALNYKNISTNLATVVENFAVVILGLLLLFEGLMNAFLAIINLFNKKYLKKQHERLR